MAIIDEIRKNKGLEKVTEKDIADMLVYALKNQSPSGAAVADYEAAKKAGISDGTTPGGFTTRWAAAVMAYRAAQK